MSDRTPSRRPPLPLDEAGRPARGRLCRHGHRSCHETYPGLFCHCPEYRDSHAARCLIYLETVRRAAALTRRRVGP